MSGGFATPVSDGFRHFFRREMKTRSRFRENPARAKWELEHWTRYHYLVGVHPRLVSRDQKRLVSTSRDSQCKQLIVRLSRWKLVNGWKPITWRKIDPKLSWWIREDFQYLVTSYKNTFRFFLKLHLPCLSEFEILNHTFTFSTYTEANIFAASKYWNWRNLELFFINNDKTSKYLYMRL